MAYTTQNGIIEFGEVLMGQKEYQSDLWQVTG